MRTLKFVALFTAAALALSPALAMAASHTATIANGKVVIKPQGIAGTVFQVTTASLATAAGDTCTVGPIDLSLYNHHGVNSSGVPILNWEVGLGACATGVDSAIVAVLFSPNGTTWYTAYTYATMRNTVTGIATGTKNLQSSYARAASTLTGYGYRYMKLYISNMDASTAGIVQIFFGINRAKLN